MHRNRQKAACASSWIYIDTIFTARRYGPNRGLCCRPVSVHPSVCLSVCHVGAIVSRRLKISSNFFHGIGSPAHHSSFYDPQRLYPFPGEPLQSGRKIHGGGENLRFSTEIAIYLGNGRPLVAMEF